MMSIKKRKLLAVGIAGILFLGLSIWRISWVNRTFAMETVVQGEIGEAITCDGLEYRILGYEWVDYTEFDQLSQTLQESISAYDRIEDISVLLVTLGITNIGDETCKLTMRDPSWKLAAIRVDGYENQADIYCIEAPELAEPGETVTAIIPYEMSGMDTENTGQRIDWILSVYPRYFSIRVQ